MMAAMAETAAMPRVGVPPKLAVVAMGMPQAAPALAHRAGLSVPTWVRVWAMQPSAPSAKPWSRPRWR